VVIQGKGKQFGRIVRFVFCMHQGYMFYFVRVSEAMEPPVSIKTHPSLADFLNYHLEAYIQYRADYLAQIAEGEKNNPRHAKEMKDRVRRLGDDF
jgi:hypothetical protein